MPLSRHGLSFRKPTYNCLPAWLGPKGDALSGGYGVMERFPGLKPLGVQALRAWRKVGRLTYLSFAVADPFAELSSKV